MNDELRAFIKKLNGMDDFTAEYEMNQEKLKKLTDQRAELDKEIEELSKFDISEKKAAFIKEKLAIYGISPDAITFIQGDTPEEIERSIKEFAKLTPANRYKVIKESPVESAARQLSESLFR